jgi:Flp pilus assembly protein TadG
VAEHQHAARSWGNVPAAGAARHVRAERGAVTAETAVVLPVLLAVTLGLVWLVSLAATQVRVVDGAREVARAAARDDDGVAVGLGRRVAPTGSRISVKRAGGTVEATVSAVVRGPGGLFAFLPAVEVSSQATTAEEVR